MRTLSLLALLILALPVHATLFRCEDAAGHVTYTNLPCDKAGLKEAKVIPPAPPPAEPAPVKPEAAPAAKSAEKESKEPEKKKSEPTMQLIRSQESKGDKCAQINKAMGKIMDDMDAARRQGYTTKQETEWNAKLKKLQADKATHGCF